MSDEIRRKLEIIDSKVDKLDSRLDNVDKILVQQHESLKHHIYRTELAEKRLHHIEDSIDPIKSHVDYVKGGIKLLSLLAMILGILKYLGKI